MKFKVLILDDEKIVCNSLRRILQSDEIDVHTAMSMEEARKLLDTYPFDLLLLDFRLKDGSGLSFLEEVNETHPEVQTVIITAFGNIEIAVKAMKMGAFDFIQKNVEPDLIRFTVRKALDNLRLKKEVDELRLICQQDLNTPDIISFSPQMQHALKIAQEFAKTDTTVLISGETGTGKSLVAEFIHLKSQRFSQPFITINCAAIPRELIESELFGYEKGAFTGASQKGKPGLIEQANGGTLFLDEIGELPIELQSKLLHVLERNEYFRIGAVEPTSVDVRFIAATNVPLEDKVERGDFRLDLFYRLNVATIHLPPLRERKEDILPLAKHFINEFNAKFNKDIKHISPEAEHYLENAPWKGNIRELKNTIERAMLLIKGDVLEVQDLLTTPAQTKYSVKKGLDNGVFQLKLRPDKSTNLLHEAQKQLVEQALTMCNQNRTRAAQLLGIPRTSLNFYIQKFGLNHKHQTASAADHD